MQREAFHTKEGEANAACVVWTRQRSIVNGGKARADRVLGGLELGLGHGLALSELALHVI
jgi:hypothetical protein